tara:strand:+ start:2568 stop:3773 length:1206 start_codon:yes stop_codon:yes gene_type:complete
MNLNIYLLYLLLILFSCNEEQSKYTDQGDIPTLSENWELLWSDEFNDEELDLTKWNKLNWKPGWVNNELQAYTDRDTNIFLENGHLVLQGNIEPGYSGTDYVGNNYVADYTSGRVNTDDKFSTTYGRFDIKAKLPAGKGSWPAIWMLGESISSIGWPQCGEIDIMEHVGYDQGLVHGSIHTQDYNHMYGTQKSGSKYVDDITDAFHVYSLEWSPFYLRYLIDNEPFFFVYNDSNGDFGKWPFNDPHYLILNLAIGGDWGGVQGVSASAFPMKMYIDYVRVYKKSDTYNYVEVTFKVDMSNENISGSGVWLSGGDLGSGQPGGIQMLQSENPNIWQTTLTLAPNSNYTYKFRNGHFPNSWQGGWENVEDNCGFGEHNNRLITVNSTDTVLVAHCFGDCLECE